MISIHTELIFFTCTHVSNELPVKSVAWITKPIHATGMIYGTGKKKSWIKAVSF
jgi:hypothetical protein